MIQNRRFALAFRAGACLFAAAGLLKQIGVFGGTISFRSFMYYTLQSNLLAIVLFAYLAVKTAKSLREGAYGNAGWHPLVPDRPESAKTALVTLNMGGK